MATFSLQNLVPTFLQNIFFRQSDKFYFRGSYRLGQRDAIYLDANKPYELYNTISELKQVIDKKAIMFSNMDIKLIKSDTREEVEDKDLNKLLHNPNIFQSMNKWLRNFKTQEQIYGNQFIYKNKPSNLSKYPVSLVNISPAYMKPFLTGKVYDQVSIDGVISKYVYEDEMCKKNYETKDILYTKLDDLDNPIIGKSPLISLRLPLSNTKLAYDYRNVIMAEKGAIGILANRSSDAVGKVKISQEEKDKINNMYSSKYGIGAGQQRVILTENDLQWQPMTYPTSDLLLFEEVDANKLTIIDHFGLNVNIFSNKNATFENVKQSLIQCYQDTIMPEADEFMQALGKFIGVPAGHELYACYDHLSILQEDKNKEEDILSKRVASVKQLVDSGIITPEMGQQMIASIGIELGEIKTTSLMDKLNRLSPLVSNNVLSNLTINEIRNLVGLPNVQNGDQLVSATPVSFNSGV